MLFIIHLLKTTQFEVMSLISYCLSLYKMVACMKRKIFKQQAATHESPNRVMVGPFQKLNLLEKFDVWSKCPHLDFFPSPHNHHTCPRFFIDRQAKCAQGLLARLNFKWWTQHHQTAAFNCCLCQQLRQLKWRLLASGRHIIH